ncbi:hypothetical protein LTSESEN_2288 [Salmonella enterica subsp. enterica serovar Senftenberg str. A4-543]|uniref:Uncharacterized protein n=1 Tax=Salmonella enterica subsp. enterica serovar Senftenberg str. A4-543 TaxID=913082 RepID=G5QZD6_SALSE|nr:hypothetical protein LTSESEN_2288 [Salmonella enterica subsp. enterica serovar Senftenberg str. A4-543]
MRLNPDVKSMCQMSNLHTFCDTTNQANIRLNHVDGTLL